MTGEGENEPWIRYRDSELYAIPSVHHRQVFSQSVIEAFRRLDFDIIAVELPPSSEGLVRKAAAVLPTPSLVVSPIVGTEVELEIPISEEADAPVGKRIVREGVFLPVTTADSLAAAVRSAIQLQESRPERLPEIAFIDAEYETSIRQGSDLRIRDDYEVKVAGLETFFNRVGPDWELGRDPKVDGYRERVMSSRLKEFLEEGKRILFVCGAAHWNPICRLLDQDISDPPDEDFSPLDLDEPLWAPLKPAPAWLFGWHDDILFVDWRQEIAFQASNDYDKKEAVEELFREVFQTAAPNVSLRKLSKLNRFLEACLASDGRWIPKVDPHLFAAAEACVGKPFAETLKRTSLYFPAPLPENSKWAGIRPYQDDSYLAYLGDEVFVLRFPKCHGTGEKRSLPVNEELTHREQRELDSDYGMTRDWPYDQKLLYQMDGAARALANDQEKLQFSSRFSGSFQRGLDTRRTVRARARGDAKGLFVRHEKTIKRPLEKDLVPVTPVVWVFDAEAPIIGRTSKNGWLSPGRMGVTALVYMTEMTYLAGDRIRGEKMGAFTDIGLSKAYLGSEKPDVFDGDSEMEEDTRYLNSLPEEKLCTWETLYHDEILAGYYGIDHAIASGIRFGRQRIILVAPGSMRLSHEVERYAAEKEVEITRLDLDQFDADKIERFRWIYWVPCPGDDGYARPYDWCERFVPPV